MTDRKLLEEIERQYLGREGDYVDWTLTLSAQTFNKVIQFAKEQAKRVQELEQQNKRYREALEFYANDEAWGLFDHHGRNQINMDGGKIARKALEGEEK